VSKHVERFAAPWAVVSRAESERREIELSSAFE
jgi:hypothetical protein